MITEMKEKRGEDKFKDPVSKKKVTPERAQQILQLHGTAVTLSEAQIILDFMYKFSKLSIDNQLKIKLIRRRKK